MNTDIVQSRFLSNPQDLGVVAVGFSKGQVRTAKYSDIFAVPVLQLRNVVAFNPRVLVDATPFAAPPSAPPSLRCVHAHACPSHLSSSIPSFLYHCLS